MKVKVGQLYPTLCNPMDCSLLGLSVHRILQARILEWVAIPFSRGSSQPKDWTQVSHIAGGFFTIWAPREAPYKNIWGIGLVAKSCPVLATTWTIACQAPLSMAFSRQEYWNGLPFPLQWIFLIQGSNPGLLHCRQILYWLNYKGSPIRKYIYIYVYI